MNRDDWRAISVMTALAILIIFTGAAMAGEQRIDCVTVRVKVAEYGKAKAVIWARENGYSWSQINEARKCLKG